MPKVKPSILLVMKDVHLRSILLDRFEREGWKAESVDAIEDGERKAVKFRPSIFLVEWSADRTDLVKMLKHWHSLPTLLKSRLVLFFPHAKRQLVDEAMHYGVDQVILGGTLSPKEIVKSVAHNLEPRT